MAASVTALPASQARPVTQADTATTQTLLRSSVERLDLTKASALEKKAILWKVAAAAALVFAAAIAVVIGLGLGFSGLALVPSLLAGLAMGYILGIITGNIMKKCFANAKDAQLQAKEIRETERLYRALPTDLNALQLLLLQKGINWITIPGMAQDPTQLLTLKPLIARMNYREQEAQKHRGEVNAAVEAALRLNENNSPRSNLFTRQMAVTLYRNAYEAETKELQWKARAAIAHAAIQRPATLDSSFGTFTSLSALENTLARPFRHAASYDTFFQFSDHNIAPITWNEARRASISELAQRMLPAVRV